MDSPTATRIAPEQATDQELRAYVAALSIEVHTSRNHQRFYTYKASTDDKIKNLNATIQRYAARVADLEKRLQKALGDVEYYKDHASKLSTEVATLKKELQQVSTENDELESANLKMNNFFGAQKAAADSDQRESNRKEGTFRRRSDQLALERDAAVAETEQYRKKLDEITQRCRDLEKVLPAGSAGATGTLLSSDLLTSPSTASPSATDSSTIVTTSADDTSSTTSPAAGDTTTISIALIALRPDLSDFIVRLNHNTTIALADADLPQSVVDNIMAQMDFFASGDKKGHGADWHPKLRGMKRNSNSRAVCLRYLLQRNGFGAWTVKHKSKYACRSCTRAGRVCFLYDHDHDKFEVLPPPVEARTDEDLTRPNEKGYYIRDTKLKRKATDPKIWEAEPRVGNKRKADEAEEGAADGEDGAEEGTEEVNDGGQRAAKKARVGDA